MLKGLCIAVLANIEWESVPGFGGYYPVSICCLL